MMARGSSHSQHTLVLGAQWGDEGKGKLVDCLSADAHAVVRFQGGHNAGHTLVVGDQTLALHLIPSGILHPKVRVCLGPGMVISLSHLFQEIEQLERMGLSVRDRLFLSSNCPLILPCHAALDQAREKHLGSSKIGTTGRGIGPAYEDKVARRALKVADVLGLRDDLREKYLCLFDHYEKQLALYHEALQPSFEESFLSLVNHADRLRSIFVGDVGELLAKWHASGARMIFEGAQGAMLDVDHGTYPFVTSSSTTLGGAASGSGFDVRNIGRVLGVSKAYLTRVGSGPLSTELFDDTGNYLVEKGHEFGTTTGRRRRCGWLDMVQLRYAARVSGIDVLAITKLDVLDDLPEIKIAVDYQEENGKSVPVYETLPGWQSTTAGVRQYADLPERARQYVERISSLSKIPVALISTGRDRNDLIYVADPV